MHTGNVFGVIQSFCSWRLFSTYTGENGLYPVITTILAMETKTNTFGVISREHHKWRELWVIKPTVERHPCSKCYKLRQQSFYDVLFTAWVEASIPPSQQALYSARKTLQSLKIGPTDAKILFDKVWGLTWNSSTSIYSQTAWEDASILPSQKALHSTSTRLRILHIWLTNAEILFNKVCWALMMCSIQCHAVWNRGRWS